ncbi:MULTISPECIES: hypothetical protein [unclassified Clostridium]|uniref:hypothetical protein n=1 Tax=unclassified Clostridium TaxID=2614128 RepID=UPI001EECC8BF|nr:MULTISPECIES: hypothetical protein [unclassified Clostridium]MDD7792999.1 hypothetical protein [Clostridium sp. 'White wine YQ']
MEGSKFEGFEGYELDEYIEEPEEIKFPKEIYIAYAVCSKQCGNVEFIVDGSSQVCQYCGKMMFRTEVKKYVLRNEHK